MSRIPDRVTPGCPAWCEKTGDHGEHYRMVLAVDGVAVVIVTTKTLLTRVTIVDILSEELALASVAPDQARDLGRVLAARDAELSQALIAAADLAESGGAR